MLLAPPVPALSKTWQPVQTEPKTTPSTPKHTQTELNDGEISTGPPATQHAPHTPRRSPHPARHDWHRHIRGSNPSPEPGIEAPTPVPKESHPKLPTLLPVQQGAVQGNGDQSRKRKISPSADQDASSSRPNKIKKIKLEQENKFSWELGHEFVGFVFHINGKQAWDVANQIHQLPVPTNVHKRLIYFCDGSIRSLCGAVGIVWTESFLSPKWGGIGVYYPLSTDSMSTLELFAIARTLELAIKDIDKERASVDQTLPHDKELFQGDLIQTRSHIHGMTKELFVFTDDADALRRIDGKLAYPPDEAIAKELEAISRHSKALHSLGVHVELHLSPGHAKIPSNTAADAMAKRTQRKLFVQTKKSWPAIESS
ncbi:hypothetical protein PITC_049230 [Penicillium italicum]|uniref:Uncharacterized protein n=1 Tax=Penicillium italicum TaxID=40296 RepID=A0A0A2K9H8_PENIT|nr:hypothetical protein PITC_049230 [Penicillium italicum]